MKRALHRHGYVVKKNGDGRWRVVRPDVVAKRAAFLESIRRVSVGRLVFLDESGMNVTMGRSHAWVLKGQEYVDLRPMNRGKTLTLREAIRRAGSCS